MFRTVITILFTLYLGQIFAQGTFFYQHDNGYSNIPEDLFERNEEYYICGYSDNGGIDRDLFLMKINGNGSVDWDLKVLKDTSVTSQELRAILDVGDGFVTGGRKLVDGDNIRTLYKFDYDGALKWEKALSDTFVVANDNYIWDLHKTDDGILIGTAGFRYNTYTTDAVLMKTDFNGNILWKKDYNSDYNEQRVDYIEKIIKIKNGYLLKMHSENQFLELFPHIIKVDEQGNEIWRKEFHYYQSSIKPALNSDTAIVFTDFTLLDSNTILTTFTKRDTVIPTYMGELAFIEFDLITGNEIAYHEVKSNFYLENRLQLFVNQYGEIITTGYCAPNDTSINHGSELYFGKFSKDYEVITEKHYGDTATNEIDHTALLTYDGGSLIAGHYFNPNIGTPKPPQFNSILYKTDCMGNLFWSDEQCFIPGKDHLEFNLYPNPFSDYITIDVPYGMKEKVEFLLYNVSGQKIMDRVYSDHRSIYIYTDGLASGMYIYKIRFKGVFVKTGKIIRK